MNNFVNLSFNTIVKEVRCEKDAQHRIEAARWLLEQSDQSERIATILNIVLYDPQPEVSSQVKSLLFEVYGNELETMLHVEGMDGVPMETPWLIPCSLPDLSSKIPSQRSIRATQLRDEVVEELLAAKDVEGLHDALRDPLSVNRRMCAVNAMIQVHTDESLEMLTRSVLYDPDANVQQRAYEALYQIAGDERAETLIDQVSSQELDEDEAWLLEPDYFDEYQASLENQEESASIFGMNKADQIRALINMFTGEKDPKKRIAILGTLAQSNDFNVNWAIARVGLFDADSRVRDYAKTELEKRLGDNLEDFLEHVYNNAAPFFPDPEDEGDMDELEEESDEQPTDNFSSMVNSQEPTVSEGATVNPIILIAGLAILGIILFLIFK